MPFDIKYYTDEAQHRAQYAARWTGGFIIRQIVSVLSGGGAINIATKTQQAMAATGSTTIWGTFTSLPIASYAFGLAGIGLGTGIRAYLNHKEMEHNEHQLMNYYRAEIAAKMGKSKNQVTEADLHALAEQNPTFQRELERNRRSMNFKTIAWAVGSAVSLIAVVGVISAAALTGVGAIAIGGLVGFATHYAAENLTETIGSNMLGFNEPSLIQRINSLERDQKRGIAITQERVMSMYVAASTDLQETIAKDFGRSYDRLSLIKQQEVVAKYGPFLNLSDVTNAINENQMNARELAFRVHGDSSNAYPDPTMHQKVQSSLQRLKHGITEGRHKAYEKFSEKYNALTSRFSLGKGEQAGPEQEEAQPQEAAPPSPAAPVAETNWVQTVRPNGPAGRSGSDWQQQVTSSRLNTNSQISNSIH